MANGTAIYITRTRAIAVRVSGSAKRPTLKAVDTLDFEPLEPKENGEPHSREERITDYGIQMRAFLKKSKASGAPVTLCIDSNDVLLRNMAIAFKDRAKIDRVIAYQVEGEIPSTPIEDLAVGYTQLAVNDNGSQLLVVAGRKDRLRDYIEILDEADSEAEAANATIGGALNLRAIHPELKKVDEPSIWIDFQGSHALFALLDGDKIIGVRNLLLPRSVLSEISRARTEFRERNPNTLSEEGAGKPKKVKAEKPVKAKRKDASADADAAPEQADASQASEAEAPSPARQAPDAPRSATLKTEEAAPPSPSSIFKRPLGSFSGGGLGTGPAAMNRPKPPRKPVSEEDLKRYDTPDIKRLIERTGNKRSEESVTTSISIRAEIGSDKIDVDPEVPASEADAPVSPHNDADDAPIFPEADADTSNMALAGEEPVRVSRGEADTTGIYVYHPGQLTAVELGKLLQVEVRRLMLSSGFDRTVRQLIVSGAPDSLAQELGPLITGLDMPKLKFIDLLEGILPRDKKGQPKIALPADDIPELPSITGTALRSLGGDVSGIDFLTGDLSPTDAFDAIKTPLMVDALTICALGAFLFMMVFSEADKLNEKLYNVAAVSGKLEQQAKEAYGESSDPEEAKKAKFKVDRENAGASVNALHSMMVKDLERIKAGGKGDAPPLYASEVVYAKVLAAMQNSLVDEKTKTMRDVALDSIQVSQRGVETKQAKGSVEINVYILVDKQTAFRRALEELEIANPVWDGKSESDRTVKLFSKVESSRGKGSIDRGVHRVNGKDVEVRIEQFTFDCTLNPVERKQAAGKSSGRPNSARPKS